MPRWLLPVALLALVALPGGLFLDWLFHDATTLAAALHDRFAVAFVVDVLLTTVVLAAYFARHPPGRWRWPWFVAFSLLTTLCFGLAIYWWLNQRSRVEP